MKSGTPILLREARSPTIETQTRMAPPPAQRFDRRIIEGPLLPAVWHLAWPTIIQNMIGGLQGILDHTMVGPLSSATAATPPSASAGRSSSSSSSSSARSTPGWPCSSRASPAQGDTEKVNRVVYQAFLTSLSSASACWRRSAGSPRRSCSSWSTPRPEVQAEALPYLRIMFAGGIGHDALLHARRGAARGRRRRDAAAARASALSVAAPRAQPDADSRLGPDSRRSARAARRSARCIATTAGRRGRHLDAVRAPDADLVPRATCSGRRTGRSSASLFRFGLPAGLQGVAMNIGGVLLLRFIGSLEHSAEAQAAYAVGYNQLFSLITWTSVGPDGRGRDGRGTEPRRRPARAREARRDADRAASACCSPAASAPCSS